MLRYIQSGLNITRLAGVAVFTKRGDFPNASLNLFAILNSNILTDILTRSMIMRDR